MLNYMLIIDLSDSNILSLVWLTESAEEKIHLEGPVNNKATGGSENNTVTERPLLYVWLQYTWLCHKHPMEKDVNITVHHIMTHNNDTCQTNVLQSTRLSCSMFFLWAVVWPLCHMVCIFTSSFHKQDVVMLCDWGSAVQDTYQDTMQWSSSWVKLMPTPSYLQCLKASLPLCHTDYN